MSYRREDSAAYAGRICDHLEAVFGEGQIFVDVEDIRPGENFARTLDERIADCVALLAVIGPNGQRFYGNGRKKAIRIMSVTRLRQPSHAEPRSYRF